MTTVECCGEERRTPFCAMCGQVLQASEPLQTLLIHCRRRVRIQEAEVTKFPETGSFRKMREERSLAKWHSWCDALAEVIAEREGKESDDGEATS